MPRQSAGRQQHHQQTSTSFGASSDSSTSYLSSKSRVQSPRSNFNPFSPLSPHLAGKGLDGEEDDSGAIFQMEDAGGGASRANRVYSRVQLLAVARNCREKGWVKPEGMGSLESWYGVTPQNQDPAIASIGTAPSRRNGGFGEGFGYGGGIGGKGLNRGGRHAGPRRNDHEPHGSSNPSKELPGGQMGKFAVRSTQDRMKLGGDENRKPREDWRRDKPPHQAQRNDHRQWNHRQEEDTAEPAWMEDQPEHDPAIAHVPDESLVQFVPGEDMIAAHKRAMRHGAENPERKPLVGFFNTDPPHQVPAKPIKEYNAANYLLPKKRTEAEAGPSKEPAGSSRFARFFGTPAQLEEPPSTVVSPSPRQPRTASPPPITSQTEPEPTSSWQPPARSAYESATSHEGSVPPLQSPPLKSRQANLMSALLARNGTAGQTPVSRQQTPPPLPDFSNQAEYPLPTLGGHPSFGRLPPPPPGPPASAPFPQLPMNAPGQMYHPQYQLGFPPPPQPMPYGPPPPHIYHPHYQQGFLPSGRPPYQPSPHSFAPEQQNYYPPPPGQLPYRPQHPPTQQHMNALLHQWSQQPR